MSRQLHERNSFKVLFIIFLVLLSLIFPPAIPAKNMPTNLSLADEVYADLAIRGYLDNVSVSFYNGRQQDEIALNEGRHWIPASTVKLFVAMYASKQMSLGKLHGGDTFIAEGKNVVPTESISNGFPIIFEGEKVSLDRLLKQMITQSDNTAFNILLDVLDRRAVTSYIQSLGLKYSAVGSKLNLDTSQEQYEFEAAGYGINTTTAADYREAFTMILQNKIANAKPLLEILRQQKINYMLPLYLPKSILVAHKHGDLDPLYHDGGIIFGSKDDPSPYVLSIFSNVGDPNLIAHLSELIYTRDPKLVGSSFKEPPLSYDVSPPIDDMVLAGAFKDSKVLGETTQILNTQPITAADLGITAKDLSLAQPTVTLPKVLIPADSPWHFLIEASNFLNGISFNDRARVGAVTQNILLQIAEAKDLISRGKIEKANLLLSEAQKKMNLLSKGRSIKNYAQAQIALQTISENRFEVLKETLQSVKSDDVRNEIIHQIAVQAKSTVTNVLPNLPLATNATNVGQHPLIGEVVEKNASSIIVKTAGGQQVTIPLKNPDVTVRTREIVFTNNQTEAPKLAISPTPKTSLSSVKLGTTVALMGSSVENTFTPVFILTNVPRELAALEPVTVVKVDQKNHTMVISENGVPVQVNVSSKTVIKGANTNISFDQIQAGDVVVVHGQPLTPVSKPSIKKPTISITPKITPLTTISISSTPGKTIDKSFLSPTLSVSNPGFSPSGAPSQSPGSSTQNSQTGKTTSPSSTQSQSQPKIIQGTSIRVVEKKEDVAKPANKPEEHKPQPKSEEKSNRGPAKLPEKQQNKK